MRTIQKFASFCKSFSKIFEETQKVSSDFRFLVAFRQEKRAFLAAAPTCLVDVQQCCRSIEVAHYEEVFRPCQALQSKIGWNFVRIFVSSLIQKEKIFCNSFSIPLTLDSQIFRQSFHPERSERLITVRIDNPLTAALSSTLSVVLFRPSAFKPA